MNDLILYRNEWYTVNQYLERGVMLEDEIGNLFHVKDKDIQVPSSNLVVYYA